MKSIAALPMYDWPEARQETDAEWRRLRSLFESARIDAPHELVRRNGDMPAVPGGIRGSDGTVIAPDPATLPPEELDFPALWLHPDLLFGQACWGPLELGLARHVQVVGQPSYDAYEGGRGEFYSSAIVMRPDAPPEGGVQAPADGKPMIPLALLPGARLAFNSLDSMSGIIALDRDLAAMNEGLGVFSERIETGGHRASIIAVAQGRADVCAIDCRSWALALEHEPAAKAVQVVGWTSRRKGLPYITAAGTPDEIVARLRAVLAA